MVPLNINIACIINMEYVKTKMNASLQVLFDSLKVEMEKQTERIHDSVTKTMSDRMDEKLTSILDENKILKSKIETLEEKIVLLERENKKKNLILFGLEEKEKDQNDLIDIVKEKIKNDLQMTLEKSEINKIHRIGKKKEKVRPILISFVNEWKKTEIIRNKKRFQEVYVTEDYPKAILDKRKELQGELEEERRKGNHAFIKYDKIVINKTERAQEKRKRMPSTSPGHSNATRKIPCNPSKPNIPNAFDVMRSRTNSLTSSPASENKE